MFLKIQYGPTQSKYFTNFSEVAFTSFLDDTAATLSLASKEDLPTNVLVNEEFLDEEKGCCKHETRKDVWYVNKVVLTPKVIKDTYQEPIEVTYTGTAYLCNSDGKTVDILR